MERSRRSATISRDTKETRIAVCLCLDGGELDAQVVDLQSQDANNGHALQMTSTQQINISTGIGFLDHMLHALAKHAGWSLFVRCSGDLIIDDHHSTEDTFLAIGEAFQKCLTSSTESSLGLNRFGSAYAPLDEALSRVVVDLSARPYSIIQLGLKREKIGDLSCEMVPHGLESFAQKAGITMHVDCLRGKNDHHRVESAFKALALALRMACAKRIGAEGEMMSTKGVLYQ
ncbi:MAG: imidazoleglycerol-phosphate dehydratase [Alyxoria varia]|nr:MAG: imidazoleglycerol-phosphate dehydratase [Alyxoria varia]